MFSFSVREIKVSTTMARFDGSGFGRKGERKARTQEGLNSRAS